MMRYTSQIYTQAGTAAGFAMRRNVRFPNALYHLIDVEFWESWWRNTLTKNL
jgi:hypothetical protein